MWEFGGSLGFRDVQALWWAFKVKGFGELGEVWEDFCF